MAGTRWPPTHPSKTNGLSSGQPIRLGQGLPGHPLVILKRKLQRTASTLSAAGCFQTQTAQGSLLGLGRCFERREGRFYVMWSSYGGLYILVQSIETRLFQKMCVSGLESTSFSTFFLFRIFPWSSMNKRFWKRSCSSHLSQTSHTLHIHLSKPPFSAKDIWPIPRPRIAFHRKTQGGFDGFKGLFSFIIDRTMTLTDFWLVLDNDEWFLDEFWMILEESLISKCFHHVTISGALTAKGLSCFHEV